MGLLYAIFSIFITLFFTKQITDVICYGRHRDRENIKSKKTKEKKKTKFQKKKQKKQKKSRYFSQSKLRM